MDVEERDQPWNLHTCKFCSYGSKSTFVMCKHVRLHQTRPKTDTFVCDSKPPEMFECKICEFETNLKVNLCEHFRVFHEDKEANEEQENILRCLQCTNCDFNTHSLLVLLKHRKTCNISYEKHMPQKDDSKDCNMGFINRFEGDHLKPKEKKWFKCVECDFKTIYKHVLKRHILHKHFKPSNTRFNCAHSSIKTNQIPSEHANPEDINSASCSYNTTHKSLKVNIIKGHWHECTQCPHKTKQKTNLRSHIFRKHSIPPEDACWFNCAQCSYRTREECCLKVHILKHFNPKEINWHKCTHCAFKTHKKHTLEKHISKHFLTLHMSNVNKVIWCAFCPFKTDQKIHLKTHMGLKHFDPDDTNWLKRGYCSFKAKTYVRKLQHSS